MSSIYDKYNKLKSNDSDKLYLFKMGMFYDFISDDAVMVSKITTLKLTNHAKGVMKCGFPLGCLDKYLDIFNNLNLDVVIVDDDSNDLSNYLNNIRDMDLDNITPIESLNILSKLKELI